MRRTVIAIAMMLAIGVASCGGDDDAEGVASLSDATTTTVVDIASANEQAVRAATECLRENGLDVPDPEMDADGNIDLENFFEIASEVDPEDAQAALEACADVVAEVDLGFERLDLTALEDTLVEFAACMRDNGFDLPDPNLTGAIRDGGPFGDVDIDDPAFETALDQCDHILEQIDLTGGDG